MAQLREVLSVPGVAATIGALVGLGLIAPLIMASRFAFAGKADAALYTTMGASMGGLIIGAAVLFGYRAAAPEGFVWFGSAVIAGFVVGIGVAALILLRNLARSDEETRS